jgi:hypothetical protein
MHGSDIYVFYLVSGVCFIRQYCSTFFKKCFLYLEGFEWPMLASNEVTSSLRKKVDTRGLVVKIEKDLAGSIN